MGILEERLRHEGAAGDAVDGPTGCQQHLAWWILPQARHTLSRDPVRRVDTSESATVVPRASEPQMTVPGRQRRVFWHRVPAQPGVVDEGLAVVAAQSGHIAGAGGHPDPAVGGLEQAPDVVLVQPVGDREGGEDVAAVPADPRAGAEPQVALAITADGEDAVIPQAIGRAHRHEALAVEAHECRLSLEQAEVGEVAGTHPQMASVVPP